MKKSIGIIFILISLALGSCTDYYFSSPQPIDTKNRYSVPKKYTGAWLLQNPKDKREDEIDSLIIGREYYKRIRKLKFAEAKSVLELDSNYYFINNKIYSMENGSLEGGFNYRIKKDTVIIDVVETELIEFGENAFIRKFNYGYILNVKHEKMNDWWDIKFIDTRNKEGIVIRELKKRDLKNNEGYEILHEDFDNYLIANWSKVDIENLINEGGFSDTTLFLKYDERIKN